MLLWLELRSVGIRLGSVVGLDRYRAGDRYPMLSAAAVPIPIPEMTSHSLGICMIVTTRRRHAVPIVTSSPHGKTLLPVPRCADDDIAIGTASWRWQRSCHDMWRCHSHRAMSIVVNIVAVMPFTVRTHSVMAVHVYCERSHYFLMSWITTGERSA